MGRAIVRNPRVFLFDEPLSNLDAKLRVQMRTEIKKLHQRVATTVIYVTHDQVEAMTLADRIVLMRDGDIEQIGTPAEIYNAPGQHLRRELHRLADHEPGAGAVRGPGRRAVLRLAEAATPGRCRRSGRRATPACASRR